LLLLRSQGLEKAVKRMFPSPEEEEENREEDEGTKYQVRITDLPLRDKLRELRCVNAVVLEYSLVTAYLCVGSHAHN
jgi:hypothetical protein